MSWIKDRIILQIIFVFVCYRKWEREVKSKALGLMIHSQFGNASKLRLGWKSCSLGSPFPPLQRT